MKERSIANKLAGWNTVEDVSKKLKIKKKSAYVYLSKLNKAGFIIQKIKKPRGTMYLISSIPLPYKSLGMYEGTHLIAPEIEVAKEKIRPEQKIAFFLSKYKEEKNRRYLEVAMNLIRKIKNWKRMYRYIKAYDVKKEFYQVYKKARKKFKKLSRIPKRYEKVLKC